MSKCKIVVYVVPEDVEVKVTNLNGRGCVGEAAIVEPDDVATVARMLSEIAKTATNSYARLKSTP